MAGLQPLSTRAFGPRLRRLTALTALATRPLIATKRPTARCGQSVCKCHAEKSRSANFARILTAVHMPGCRRQSSSKIATERTPGAALLVRHHWGCLIVPLSKSSSCQQSGRWAGCRLGPGRPWDRPGAVRPGRGLHRSSPTPPTRPRPPRGGLGGGRCGPGAASPAAPPLGQGGQNKKGRPRGARGATLVAHRATRNREGKGGRGLSADGKGRELQQIRDFSHCLRNAGPPPAARRCELLPPSLRLSTMPSI